jgi:hypothetical protein
MHPSDTLTNISAPAPTVAPAPVSASVFANYSCEPPFSLLSVRLAVDTAGYGPYLDLLTSIARSVTPDLLSAASSTCALPPDSRGDLLCSMPTDALPFTCDAQSCQSSQLSCLVSGVDPCDILFDLQPTAAELKAVAALPATPLDSNGCDAINWEGLDATLGTLRTLLKWSKRSSQFSSFALLVNALVDTSFVDSNGTYSASTRMVFAVPKSTEDDPDAGATLASSAASFARSHRSSEMEFIWRQWRYFDVYARNALMRDVAFSAGSLAFLCVYTWIHVRLWTTRSIVTTNFCILHRYLPNSPAPQRLGCSIGE